MNFFSSRIFFVLFLTVVLNLGAPPKQVCGQERVAITLQAFYDGLAPYGRWVYDRRYEYVWVPDVRDFHPYHTNGYWEMTVYGNTWVSLYPWGWAPFHYGRWMFDSYYGWVWVPGYEWAPAWVCWRYGGGYYWWAPLHPGFVLTIGFSFYDCPYYWWTSAPQHFLYGPRHSGHYVVNSSRNSIRNTHIVNHTQVDNRSNTVYATGPTTEDIRRATGKDIAIKNVRDVSTVAALSVQDEHVAIYRPQLRKEATEHKDARPAKFENSIRKLDEREDIREWNESYPQEKEGTIRPEIIRQPRQAPRQPGNRTPGAPTRNPQKATDRPAPGTKPVTQPKPAQQRPVPKAQPAGKTPQAPVRRQQ